MKWDETLHIFADSSDKPNSENPPSPDPTPELMAAAEHIRETMAGIEAATLDAHAAALEMEKAVKKWEKKRWTIRVLATGAAGMLAVNATLLILLLSRWYKMETMMLAVVKKLL